MDERNQSAGLLYVDGDKYKTEEGFKLQLSSTAEFPDSGIYIFRTDFHIPSKNIKQNYLAVMSSKKKIGHGHLDQGSFILYKNNIPVVMDTGIEGYFNVSTQWHLSSYSHACMQFGTKKQKRRSQNCGFINLSAGTYSLERGWVDVPDSSEVLEVETGGKKERIVIQIENKEGKGIHIREIIFEKETGITWIKDQVKEYDGKLLFSLPMVMESAVVKESQVLGKGYYGVNMDVIFHTPVCSIELEQGRTTPMFDTKNENPMLIYCRAVAEASVGFMVELRPYEG
ncbi:heparinase II/III-family protein [Lachnospiraceae bacterium OttesenSCG-928-D06]|nr:heparinase II/III-family protein [Lachnospiraceae bacterium OttesenSCG-928-D06]